MLNEISECQNFGSPETIYKFVRLLREPKNTVKDLNEFFNKSRYLEGFFTQDIITLLLSLNLIEVKNKSITLTEKTKELAKKDLGKFKKQFSLILAQYVFERIFLNNFLSREDIKYEEYLRKYTIKNSRIPFKYSPIKNLLIKFGILLLNIKTNLLVINNDYVEIIRKSTKKFNCNMTPEELKELILLKEEYGLDAERFVLEYEKMRIKNNPNVKNVQLISLLDVSAGYDILSYYGEKSDKKIYIEVKSYSGKISFYWSKNEIEVSREKQDDYHLYLVNRDKIKEKGYVPKIIKNPYKKIFCDESGWKKTVESWLFRKR